MTDLCPSWFNRGSRARPTILPHFPWIANSHVFLFLLLTNTLSLLLCGCRHHRRLLTGAPRTTTTELAVKIKVNVGDGEPIESALRRFKRAVSNSGHLMELRHKRYFENSQERQIRKVKEARMRIKFERMQRRRMANRT